jgi:hypothetical protein
LYDQPATVVEAIKRALTLGSQFAGFSAAFAYQLVAVPANDSSGVTSENSDLDHGSFR